MKFTKAHRIFLDIFQELENFDGNLEEYEEKLLDEKEQIINLRRKYSEEKLGFDAFPSKEINLRIDVVEALIKYFA